MFSSRKIMSSYTRACRQRAPNSVAFRTPSHAVAGCGGFQRRSPTGGAAYGMPLNTRTFEPATVVPSTSPVFVFTGAAVARVAVRRIMTADAGALGMREELDMGDILVRSRTPRTISVTEPTDKSVTDLADCLFHGQERRRRHGWARTTTAQTIIETAAASSTLAKQLWKLSSCAQHHFLHRDNFIASRNCTTRAARKAPRN